LSASHDRRYRSDYVARDQARHADLCTCPPSREPSDGNAHCSSVEGTQPPGERRSDDARKDVSTTGSCEAGCTEVAYEYAVLNTRNKRVRAFEENHRVSPNGGFGYGREPMRIHPG
jgi:hypothetical protein